MKAVKVEIVVIDFEGVGAEDIAVTLANNKYCHGMVLSTQTADIGPWDDDHPLNQRATWKAEAERIFSQEADALVKDSPAA